MPVVTIWTAVALLCAIAMYEAWRFRTSRSFDLMSVANVVFSLNFCVSPIFIALVPGTAFEIGPYGRELFMISVVKDLNLDADAYLSASLITVMAYAAMAIGYNILSRRILIPPLNGDGISLYSLMAVGLILAVLSISALLAYSAQFIDYEYPPGSEYSTGELYDDGFGIIKMMKIGMLVRGGHLDVVRGYLQVLVMLGVPALLILIAAAIKLRGWRRWSVTVVIAIVWLAVFVRVYHASGRMEFTIFIVLIPLALLMSAQSLKTFMLGGGGIFAFGIFMTLARHEFFPRPDENLSLVLSAMGTNLIGSISYILNEFAFPFPVSAKVVSLVPNVIDYRYFEDIPLAMLYMLPSLSGSDTWPEMVSHLHDRFMPLLVPYDLISYGFYNLGFAGVISIFVIFGGTLAVMDAWLAKGAGWLARAFYAAWMLYLPFRIMYADPYTSMKTGFGLIVGTILIAAMAWMAKRREANA